MDTNLNNISSGRNYLSRGRPSSRPIRKVYIESSLTLGKDSLSMKIFWEKSCWWRSHPSLRILQDWFFLSKWVDSYDLSQYTYGLCWERVRFILEQVSCMMECIPSVKTFSERLNTSECCLRGKVSLQFLISNLTNNQTGKFLLREKYSVQRFWNSRYFWLVETEEKRSIYSPRN